MLRATSQGSSDDGSRARIVANRDRSAHRRRQPQRLRGESTVVGAACAQRARGDELSQRGEYEAALAVYEEALRQEPNDVALRDALATTLTSLNRRAEATGRNHREYLRDRGGQSVS